ncbi:hypothetical protein ATW55_02095 [Ferroacidibacillus organovorans]|uniref:CidA/LrgA family protein n=1 Tax=Ferroacidibacillus organovorans TaxID=1765683 RepID=A0A117SX32_9BACL|nr:hypothetical protein ATW55_02095 [Ferroacidibacillus organovorans]
MLQTSFQIAILWAFSLSGSWLAKHLALPIPGSLIGMTILFIALHQNWLPMRFVDKGASFLLGQLLLFFIPSAVGIVNEGALIRQDGWQMLLIIGVSTLLVMVMTGFVAERIARAKAART